MAGAIATAMDMQALAKLLTQGLRQSRRTHEPVLVSLTQTLPDIIDALSNFSACKPFSFRTFWGKPAEDFWLVGCGAAAELTADGEASLDMVAEKYRCLIEHALIQAPGVSGTGPAAFGGFRYDTRALRDTRWRSFPDAMLVVPRFLITRSGRDGWLTVNVMVTPETDQDAMAESLLTELKSQGTSRSPEDFSLGRPADIQPEIKLVTENPPEQYAGYVLKALEAIRAGHLGKVVLARHKVLCGEGHFSIDSAMGWLCKHYPGCTVFAFETGGSGFFGATPESLARVHHGVLNLTCLAGSAARGRSPEEDSRLERQLFRSRKERREHKAVVKEVTASLKDLCREIEWNKEIRILKLENVQHLLTLVTGQIQPGNTILDIVKRLHPTPAVAGLPVEEAMRFIRCLEGDRGWYAAPVGWIDHSGAGEFAVAIRSALVSGNEAVLYAGAGIVEGSDPYREFAETEIKFQPMLSALSRS